MPAAAFLLTAVSAVFLGRIGVVALSNFQAANLTDESRRVDGVRGSNCLDLNTAAHHRSACGWESLG